MRLQLLEISVFNLGAEWVVTSAPSFGVLPFGRMNDHWPGVAGLTILCFVFAVKGRGRFL